MNEEEFDQFLDFELQRIDVRPTDTVMMKLNKPLTQGDYAKIQKKLVAALRDKTKSVKIIILDPRIELTHQEF